MEEDGIRTRLPECQAARNLTALARLRIRLRFEEGKTAEAVDDAVDALTLGRHVSRDGTLIAVLVGIAIDAGVTDTLAADLPKLDKAELKKLAARLERCRRTTLQPRRCKREKNAPALIGSSVKSRRRRTRTS